MKITLFGLILFAFVVSCKKHQNFPTYQKNLPQIKELPTETPLKQNIIIKKEELPIVVPAHPSNPLELHNFKVPDRIYKVIPVSDEEFRDRAEISDIVTTKSIGRTSVVLKTRFAYDKDQKDTVFLGVIKPQLKAEPNLYISELIAYKLAQALQIPNVRFVMTTTLPVEKLQLSPDILSRLKIRNGQVNVVIMPWITSLQEIELDFKQHTYWQDWLFNKNIPESHQQLAQDLSNLILFDYLTGNPDRWSGGNIVKDGSNQRLVFMDNDHAFGSYSIKLQTEAASKILYVSRDLVNKIRDFSVTAFMKNNPDLLSQDAANQMEKRRKQLLQYLDNAGDQVEYF